MGKRRKRSRKGGGEAADPSPEGGVRVHGPRPDGVRRGLDLAQVAKRFGLFELLGEAVLVKVSNRGASDAEALWAIIASLARGHGALPELDALRSDAVARALLGIGHVPEARRAGEWLARLRTGDVKDLWDAAVRFAERVAPAIVAHEVDVGGYVPLFIDATGIEAEGGLFERTRKEYEGNRGYWLHATFLGGLWSARQLQPGGGRVCQCQSKIAGFCSLYTDRGSHYWHTPEAGSKVDRASPTQFGRAMARLGVEMVPAYSPEARGRSERMFGTHQDRLVKELALEGITEMAEANRYIQETYLPTFNAEFARPPREDGSAFVPMGGAEALDDILCEVHERVVGGRDNCVRFDRLTLQIEPDGERPHYVKAKVKVRRHMDGSLSVWHGPRLLRRYGADGAPRPESLAEAA